MTESTEPWRWYVDTGLVNIDRREGGGKQEVRRCPQVCGFAVDSVSVAMMVQVSSGRAVGG